MRRSGVAAGVAALGLALTGAGTASGATQELHPVNPLTGVALSPCFSSDHGTPVITSIHLSRGIVDVRHRKRTVQVVAHVHDTGGPGPASGIASVRIFATLAALGPTWHAPDGTWRATIRVPRGSQPVSGIVYAIAVDRVGNSTEEPGPHGSLPEPTSNLLIRSTPDSNPPTLRNLRLARTRVNTTRAARKVDVGVLALDRGSGVASVSLVLVGPGDARTREVTLRRVAGDGHRGRWVGRAWVPRWSPTGRWVPRLMALDRYGNFTLRPPTPNTSGSALPTLRVRSRPGDATPPVLSAISASPGTIDVSTASRRVTIDVHATDPGSGVGSLSLRLNGGAPLPARLIAGTPYDGTWRVSLTIDPCEPAAMRVVQLDRMSDRRGNVLECGGCAETRTTFNVDNVDRVGPSLTEQYTSDGTLRITFNEDVVGVTSDSASVRRSHSPFDSDNGRQLEGGWLCADSASASVDCTTGPVRSAVFVPDEPLPADGFIFARLDPDHVLDLTDLAGNPAAGIRLTDE